MQYAAVFVTQYISSLSSFVPNFRILTQVVVKKSLPVYFIRVTEGKIEKRQNEDKHLNFHLHNTLCQGVHKI